jgi:hypothetical protein
VAMVRRRRRQKRIRRLRSDRRRQDSVARMLVSPRRAGTPVSGSDQPGPSDPPPGCAPVRQLCRMILDDVAQAPRDAW